jgi:hypothetical protein
MERTNCVICNETSFIDNFNLLNTIDIVSSEKYNHNEKKNLKFVSCNNCGCVQLKNLFLQSEIYSQPLQIFNGPNFNGHHDSFSIFFINNIIYENDIDILEIGGSYGGLAKRIIKKYNENNINIKYKILEYDSSCYPLLEQIEYISGDCENYNYYDTNTIIMSHVFEHLYKPREFLEKMRISNVQNIFISIPDMDNLTENGDLNNLNILHTFYLNSQYIIYLFNMYGFNIKHIQNYNNNSNFYYFKRENNITLIPSFKNLELPIKQQDFYNKNMNTIKKINIEHPFYICPSGFYGQFVYFNLNENTKKNVLGFLDSDPYKINKRLCGTELTIFKKEIIKDKENIHILISSKKHTNEIKDELYSYNNNTVLHYI